MKILLDECVTKQLKSYLPEFEVFTVREMGWGGIKNGNLMALCVEKNFDVLLTIDKNFPHQQNLEKHQLTIVILNSFTSKIEELITFLPRFTEQIKGFKKYQAYIIEPK